MSRFKISILHDMEGRRPAEWVLSKLVPKYKWDFFLRPDSTRNWNSQLCERWCDCWKFLNFYVCGIDLRSQVYCWERTPVLPTFDSHYSLIRKLCSLTSVLSQCHAQFLVLLTTFIFLSVSSYKYLSASPKHHSTHQYLSINMRVKVWGYKPPEPPLFILRNPSVLSNSDSSRFPSQGSRGSVRILYMLAWLCLLLISHLINCPWGLWFVSLAVANISFSFSLALFCLVLFWVRPS